MKLTAELALKQVKGNKKRTLGAVIATTLSTALLTAVMSFVTSGYKMLEDFLEPGLGEYSGAYRMLLFVPALFLSLLIAFMSVTVISNIYEISASKRLIEFGVLKCVGATGKQIRETVRYESLWISLFAVPAGLLLGTLIGFIGVLAAGRYVSYFNDLSRSIIMRPFSFSLEFHVSFVTYVLAAIVSFLVILISAGKPARRSGNITAIQCMKGIHDMTVGVDKVNDRIVIEKLFGYEGNLAYKNIKRNKSGYRSSIRALALSITLILFVGSFEKQAQGAIDWMTGMGDDMLVDYTSVMNDTINEKTGKPQAEIAAPIPYDTADRITERLREYQADYEVIGVGSDKETFKAIPDADVMSAGFLDTAGVLNEYGEIKCELITVDRDNYSRICEKAGVPVGSNILINSYAYNDNGEIKTMAPIDGEIHEITLIDAANETKMIKIEGMLTVEELASKAFNGISQPPIRVIIPTGDSRYFTWYSNPEDDEDFTKFARGIMDEIYPILTEDSYIEQGYSVRISRADQMIKVMNIAVILGEILLMGLIILLIVMGLAGVISTLSSSIRMRKREFAVLKSVGMTRASLEKMIFCESIICSSKASITGITTGILLPWLINLSIRKVLPVKYELPLTSLFIGILIVFVIMILVAKVEIQKLRGQNMIEDIRMDLM